MEKGNNNAPLLQLALDIITIEEAKIIISDLKECIDIVEIGTPLVLKYGVEAIKEVRKSFPDVRILADFKIADAGEYESQLAFNAGADIVTVLAAAPYSTIEATLKQAGKNRKSVMVDTIGMDDFRKRIPAIDEMGAKYICAHTGFDEQNTGNSPLKNLVDLKKYINKAKIAVAGGVNISNIKAILKLHPDIIIIGSAIMSSEHKRDAAINFKKIIGQRPCQQ